jgi:N6-L-threonylcarbamoyladenine synthase
MKRDHPKPEDLARGFVDAVVEVLVAKCARAVRLTGLKNLVVAGGVGANKQLRAGLDAEGARRGFEVFYPEPELCTDNGAMIAFVAALRLQSGLRSGPQAGSRGTPGFSVKPRWDLSG